MKSIGCHKTIWLCTFALCGTWFAEAQQTTSSTERKFKEVNAEDLLQNPQNFWSTGILVYDTLEELPSDRDERIAKKKYYKFKTRDIGKAYAGKDLYEMLATAQVGQEFVFSGTVLNHRREYIVVFQSATPTIEAIEEAPIQDVDLVINQLESSTEDSLRQLSDFLKRTITALTGLSQSEGLPIEQLLANKTYRDKAMGSIRRALNDLSIDTSITPGEILTGYALHLLVLKYSDTEAYQEALAASEEFEQGMVPFTLPKDLPSISSTGAASPDLTSSAPTVGGLSAEERAALEALYGSNALPRQLTQELAMGPGSVRSGIGLNAEPGEAGSEFRMTPIEQEPLDKYEDEIRKRIAARIGSPDLASLTGSAEPDQRLAPTSSSADDDEYALDPIIAVPEAKEPEKRNKTRENGFLGFKLFGGSKNTGSQDQKKLPEVQLDQEQDPADEKTYLDAPIYDL
jgi:hypothetical protein